MSVSQIHFNPYKSVLIQQQTGTANLIVIKSNFRTLSSQGLFESIVINLYPNKAYQLWQQSFKVLAP